MTALDELRTSYGALIGLVADLTEGEQWVPTGCAGWCVRDLVFHLMGDAQRATVHGLDLVVHLDRPEAPAASLALVRDLATELLGEPFPAGLDDAQVARVATGRAPAPAELTGRVPLFG